jgi:hypothetical protein
MNLHLDLCQTFVAHVCAIIVLYVKNAILVYFFLYLISSVWTYLSRQISNHGLASELMVLHENSFIFQV